MRAIDKAELMMDLDPEWASIMYLFKNHSKLQNYLVNDYFNRENGFVDVKRLLKISKKWSRSERFMLRLAIHLFNCSVKVDLNDIDYPDANNKRLVSEVLKIRFKRA